ncbi:MAG: DUF2085 domain-containing protein [Chloroflexota bacterium]|nr:DUF2085 domain-containing protein [Chloroflexota bacterium]
MSAEDNVGKVTTAEVLAEVERRRAAAAPAVGERQRRIVILADRFVFWLSKHWLAVFNTLALLYVGLPILAPVLIYLGAVKPAAAIHLIYKPLCHQMPHRSWFLFGPQFAYTLKDLVVHTGIEPLSTSSETAFLIRTAIGYGDKSMGYKVAFCQRDVAIYGAIFLAGLLYTLGRQRVRPLPWWGYLLGLLPMGMDGGYQLLSSLIPYLFPDFPISPYESTPLTRTITGGIFGLVTIWLAYPYVQETMDEFRETLHRRFGWE